MRISANRFGRLFAAAAALLASAGASRAAEISVADFSAICGSGANAVVCDVGDTVVLPSGEYTINNPRVASISANTVTALEPGFTGVLDSGSNVGGIIVRPSVGGSGRVFVAMLDTTTVLQNTQSIALNWSDESIWRCVDGGGGYPNAADDVAMIPVSINTTADNAKNNYAGYYLTFDGEITIGQLFFGSFKPGNLNIRLRPGTAGNATLAFARTDGEAPLLAVSGNAATAHNTWVRFVGNGDRNLSLDLSNGLLADLGYVEDESGSTVSHFLFQQGSLSIPAGKRLTFVNGQPGHTGSNGEDSGVEFYAGYALGGTGTIRNDSDMNLRVDSEGNAIFAGSWESGGKRPRSIPASPVGAGIDFRKATAAGCTAISDGAFSIESNWGAYDAYRFQYSGSGGIKIGSGSNNYNSGTGLDFYTDRIRSVGQVILNSGLLGIWPESNSSKNWGSDVITTRVDRLTFGYGLSKLHFWGAGSTDTHGATNFVDIVAVDHQNRAQAYVYSTDFWDAAANVAMVGAKVKTKFEGASDLVIPWMAIIARKKGLLPARVDEDGFLYTEARTDGVRLSDATPGGNALVHSASLSLTADLTVNSLSVGSIYNKDQFLGAGRTLTITSGALYLWDGNSIVGVEGGNQNGRIVFAAPAYVHTIVATNNPAKINLPLIAPQGIAFGAPGGVRVTGDQTGIEQELAVNGCRLVLGTATTPAQLDVDIRVAGGYSVLDVQNVNANFLKKHRLTLQDSGNYPAQVALASGTYPAKEFFVGTRKMRSGTTYGSSASTAENIDDVHFSGAGVLQVETIGTVIVVK